MYSMYVCKYMYMYMYMYVYVCIYECMYIVYTVYCMSMCLCIYMHILYIRFVLFSLKSPYLALTRTASPYLAAS